MKTEFDSIHFMEFDSIHFIIYGIGILGIVTILVRVFLLGKPRQRHKIQELEEEEDHAVVFSSPSGKRFHYYSDCITLAKTPKSRLQTHLICQKCEKRFSDLLKLKED